jgi:hypothetical protein
LPSAPPVEARAVETPSADAPAAPPVELDQVTEAWDRSILDAVRERSIPVASLLTEATPTDLADDKLTLAFPAGADFHRRQIAEPENIGLLRDALYEVTGRRLTVVLESREADEHVESADDEPLSEEDVFALLKETFDAHEVEEPAE